MRRLGEHKISVGNHDAKQSGFQLIELYKHGNHFTFLQSKPMGIVNKWQALQNKHTVNNKQEINSHTKIEVTIKCKSKSLGTVKKWPRL